MVQSEFQKKKKVRDRSEFVLPWQFSERFGALLQLLGLPPLLK